MGNLLIAIGQQAPAWSASETLSAVRGIVATAFVLGLLGVLAWLMRRGSIKLGASRGRSPVSVETAVSLGERRSLVIVTVEGRRLLLGLTTMNVSLVTELGPATTASFDDALQRKTTGT